MPEASFYILPSQSLSDRFLFACKLIEKAYRCGQYCYVVTDSLQQSQQLDNLLWTFRKNSFIPHQIFDEPDNKAPEFDTSFKSAVNIFRILFSYLSDDQKYLSNLQPDESFVILKDVKPQGVYKYIDNNGAVTFKKQ